MWHDKTKLFHVLGNSLAANLLASIRKRISRRTNWDTNDENKCTTLENATITECHCLGAVHWNTGSNKIISTLQISSVRGIHSLSRARKAQTHKDRKNARWVKSEIKSMLIIFFDFKGIVRKKFVLAGQKGNSANYCDVLRRLRENERRLRPELWRQKKWSLHHDNEQSHTFSSHSIICLYATE
jgi:hypothetical protein